MVKETKDLEQECVQQRGSSRHCERDGKHDCNKQSLSKSQTISDHVGMLQTDFVMFEDDVSEAESD